MNEKKILLTIFLIAIFLRIGGNIVREKVFFHRPFLVSGIEYNERIRSDSVWYNNAAMAFLKGKGVVSSLRVEEERRRGVNFDALPKWIKHKKVEGEYYAHKMVPPLYPLFLALCYYLGGTNTLSYFIPQVILGSLTCLFIYLIAKEIFNNEKIAVLAGFAVAFYPDLIFWTNFVRVETLFIFLLALGFWLLIKGNSKENISLIFMSAIVFGLACLTRITFIPFIPILFLWQVLFFKKDKKRSFKVAFLMVLLIFLVLLPWCVRNYLVFDEFTPFTDEIGVVLVGDDPGKFPEGEFYYRSYNSSIVRTIAYIKDHSNEYFLSSLKRLITFWSPITAPMKKIAKVYKTLTWIIIFPLAFWGIIVSRRSWGKCGLLIIIFIFYHALLHAGSFVDKGLVYRYPIQPFLCIFAAYGFWIIYKNVKYNGNLTN